MAVVSSLDAFVIVSLLAFLVALLLLDGIALPAMIGVLCGFAAATGLNVTDALARRTRRETTGDRDDADRDDRREDGRVP